jgi:hypothetical protein
VWRPVEALGFTGRDLRYIVEPGEIRFFVGSSSADLVPAGSVTIVGDAPVATIRSTTNHVIDQPGAN